MTPPFPASGTPNSPFAGLINGRPTPLPPGIAARVDITPDSVQRAAVNFATGQQHLADAWMRLQTGLNANAGMAGTGAPAKAFTSKYDPALQTIWKGFDSGIIHLGATSKGLTQTANNHLKADHHSRADSRSSGPEKLPFARVYPRHVAMAEPGPATGQGGSGLPGPLARLWPNASVDGLNAAAFVWRSAAKEIHTIGDRLHWTIGTITVPAAAQTSTRCSGTSRRSGHRPVAACSANRRLLHRDGQCLRAVRQQRQQRTHQNEVGTCRRWGRVTITTAGGVLLTPVTGGGPMPVPQQPMPLK